MHHRPTAWLGLVAGLVVACSGQVVVTPTPTPAATPSSSASVSPTSAATATVSPSGQPSPSAKPPQSGSVEVKARTIVGPFGGTVRPSVVWTGSEAIFWGGWPQAEGTIGVGNPTGRGAGYDPDSESWRELAEAPISPRAGHFAAWTGSEMLIWGGYSQRGIAVDGAAYDPVTDTWRDLAPAPSDWTAPLGTDDDLPPSASAWTGSDWVIAFEERDATVRLAAYDPSSDEWRQLPSAAGSTTDGIELAWTGTELVLVTFEDIWRLIPAGSGWERVSNPPGPWSLAQGSAVSSDGQLVLIVDATGPADQRASLAIRNSQNGSWRLLPPPPARTEGTMVASDGRHLLWLGSDVAYDTVNETWLAVPIPIEREDAASVWTGTELIVWGGWLCEGCPVIDEGTVYTPDW